MYSGDQKMQPLKDSEANIEDLDIVSKENEHPMDLIVVPLLESQLDHRKINQLFLRFHMKICPLKFLTMTLSLEMNNKNNQSLWSDCMKSDIWNIHWFNYASKKNPTI